MRLNPIAAVLAALSRSGAASRVRQMLDVRFPDTSKKGARRDRGLPVQRRPRVAGIPLRRERDGQVRYYPQMASNDRGARVPTGALISVKREALRQGGAA